MRSSNVYLESPLNGRLFTYNVICNAASALLLFGFLGELQRTTVSNLTAAISKSLLSGSRQALWVVDAVQAFGILQARMQVGLSVEAQVNEQ